MTVYVVLAFERHSDPDVELFTSQQAAVDRARALVREYAHPDSPEDVDEDLTEPMRRGGWLYHGSWSPESERVVVVEREIR
jgi:hypothetical protein